ncbi:MAG TPA: threonine synthase [Saprospiraceae bacterium]|nr:threonine synthase [Saprospiraceae bacterium]
MKLYSTKNKQQEFTLGEAVLKGLPDDNGLFMPAHIPKLPDHFFKKLPEMSFPELSFAVAYALIDGAIPYQELEKIVFESIDFPAPVVRLDEQTRILELFHGPTLAFKDFGARFMARTMSYFNRTEKSELTILVATSGDTGGAVASGFYDIPGINVIILYPKGKVSHLQEQQLTTLGKNITALEVDGTFDDCQALVKKAFLDKDVTQHLRISSANSINIARLIPQSFYYFEAWKQVFQGQPPVFITPSGNFGNITAGLFAQKMGLPVKKFIAANNANNIFYKYLQTGEYHPKPSIQTISNAMDVGAPSNFARIMDLYGSTWNNVKADIDGFTVNDDATLSGINQVFTKYQYIIDPHGAVGYLAFKEYQKKNPDDMGIILETAHPSKFIDVLPEPISKKVIIPERLAVLAEKTKVATPMSIQYKDFKEYLLNR